jgi:hypothetical protein
MHKSFDRKGKAHLLEQDQWGRSQGRLLSVVTLNNFR